MKTTISITHIAIRHEQHEFILASMNRLPKNKFELLISEKNTKGNTPLHIAAEVGNLSIVKLLHDYLLLLLLSDEKMIIWRVKNSKGNTPLHVALVHDNVKVARFLLEKDPSLACVVNQFKEAPLHLAIDQTPC